jgi:phenylalanyl-tRNA synthetase alpha chain
MKKEDIELLLIEAKKEINSLDLESFRVKYIGRKGLISDFFSKFKDLNIEDKKVLGPLLNKAKIELNDIYLNKKETQKEDKKEFFDYTLKGKKIEIGSLSPVSIVQKELCEVFKELGFQIVEGPEIENEYYNFDALNIPKDHPARDLWDTF